VLGAGIRDLSATNDLGKFVDKDWKKATAFNPAGTRWSVAAFDDNGQLGNFHPTPWEFNLVSMNEGTDWAGGYIPKPGDDDAYICEIIAVGSSRLVVYTTGNGQIHELIRP
jgi:hypothetical protein